MKGNGSVHAILEVAVKFKIDLMGQCNTQIHWVSGVLRVYQVPEVSQGS